MQIAVIGGGPAGLRAAEVAASHGAAVVLFDAMPSVGRKLLVAGRGGLNLTNAEPFDLFLSRYHGGNDLPNRWRSLLADFDSDKLQDWALGLGVETFAAGTGRVYPKSMRAAPLLRRWILRLRSLGVQFAMRHRWTGLIPGPPHRLAFSTPAGEKSAEADAVILALGGGSWPETGSDGSWTSILSAHGVGIDPLQPANCGWEVAWPTELLTIAEGKPLKNVAIRAGDSAARGELLVTRYGLEGGAIYQLGRILRSMPEPQIIIDFKPDSSPDQLLSRLEGTRGDLTVKGAKTLRLSEAAVAVLKHFSEPAAFSSKEQFVQSVKQCVVRLAGPRPIAEAISSAGGVRWSELDDGLMLKRLSGVFVAGEMISWEAPTGGYLIQGCFATGTRAGASAANWLRSCSTR